MKKINARYSGHIFSLIVRLQTWEITSRLVNHLHKIEVEKITIITTEKLTWIMKKSLEDSFLVKLNEIWSKNTWIQFEKAVRGE